MDEQGASDTDAALLTDAYAAARQLLRQAEEDATRIRADADRYRRQREQEAELIVGKARRLLAMAEERAAAPGPVVVDVDAPAPAAREEEAQVHDLDAVDRRTRRAPSGLDAILATAVSNAIQRALPSES